MIVKNEAHVIETTLTNLIKYFPFSYWVISDTGSTDNTIQIIETFFEKHNIPGEIHQDNWVDFGHNRTRALEHAYNKTDYLLIFDADDTIKGVLNFPSPLKDDAYLLTFGSIHGVTYERPLLISNRIKWRYVGVLHEYLDSYGGNFSTCAVKGDYEIVSGRSGSRNSDSQKYLKDAQILEKAYEVEVQKKNDTLADRYAFYCANSYFDYGDFTHAIKWYKITVERNGWNQERYSCCLKLYKCYKRLGQMELGQFYLVKSVQYCDTRVECIYKLVEYYCKAEQYNVAYAYYTLVKSYYESKYLEEVNAVNLFVDNRIANFFMPYFVIIAAEKTKQPESAIKMYQIIFIKRTEHIPAMYIACVLHNFQFTIPVLKELQSQIPDFVSHMLGLFNNYILFAIEKKYDVMSYDFWNEYSILGLPAVNDILSKQRENNNIPQITPPTNEPEQQTPVEPVEQPKLTQVPATPKPVIRFDVSKISSLQNIIDSANQPDNTKEIKNILIFAGFGVINWNYTYGLHNALGGSERAVNYLASCFPKDYRIYISGNVGEETIGNVTYVNLTNIRQLINSTSFHTVIISRYIAFFDMFPQTITKQYFIWAHDTSLSSYGTNKSDKQLIEENYDKIDGLVCLTKWHVEHLLKQYPLLKDKVNIINNGINPEMFNLPVEKVKNRFVYTSCSERGLERLLQLWPSILENIPDATLHISSYNSFPCHDLDRRLEPTIKYYNTSITHHGKLNQPELYKLMCSSEYWLYPTSWPETSCITALEMLSSGVLCLFYDYAGLTETINHRGIVIRDTKEITQLMAIHNMPQHIKNNIIQQGKLYANACSWSNRALVWKEMIEKNAQLKTSSYEPIKIVNLKMRTDRKEKLLDAFKQQCFTNYQFVEAVYGKELAATNDIKELFKGNDFKYRKGVIGCALSHIGLWQQLCRDANNEYYVIVEDDITMCDDFGSKLEITRALFEKNNCEFAYIGRQKLHICSFDKNTLSIDAFKPELSAYGTCGYIISKIGCKKLLRYIYTHRVKRAIDCVDLFTNAGMRLHSVNKCLVDAPTYQLDNNMDTDIQTSNDGFTFHNKNVDTSTLTVAFIDWWVQEYCGGSFNQSNNLLVNLLKKYSERIHRKIKIVQHTESPDILFYSLFGNQHKQYLNNPDIRCIFYSGEPCPPRAEAAYNFTFVYDVTGKNTRLPLWICYDTSFLVEESIQRKNGNASITGIHRDKFCSCIISNNGNEIRRNIIEALNKYKRVDCGGSFLNNIGFVVPRGENCSGKLEHNKRYKFVVALENTDYPGYCTEKLADSFKSGSLPIYWGNKEGAKDFNPKSFINVNDFDTLEEMVDYVIKVDQDEDLYKSYFKVSILNDSWLDILSQPLTHPYFNKCFDNMIGISSEYIELQEKCKLQIDANQEWKQMKGKRIVICGSDVFLDPILNEVMDSLHEYGYDISYGKNYEECSEANPEVIMFVSSVIPIGLIEYCNINNITKYILNLEQLTRPSNKNILLHNFMNVHPTAVIDYSKTNSYILDELGISHFVLPTLFNQYDAHHLQMLKKQNEQKYDFGIIGYRPNLECSMKRQTLVNHLRKVGFSVNVVNGWGHSRDNELSKCNCILNIHHSDEYQIYEHLRCNRLLDAGYNVLSEDSLHMKEEVMTTYSNLKVVKYDTLMQLTKRCEWDEFKSIY